MNTPSAYGVHPPSTAYGMCLTLMATVILGGCGSGSSDGSDGDTEQASSHLSRVESNEEFVSYLKEGLHNISETGGYVSYMPPFLSPIGIAENAINDSTESDGSAGAPVANSGSFSSTNVIESGVDEEDVVKYDGEILYVVQQADRPFDWISIDDDIAATTNPAPPTPGTIKLFQTSSEPTAAELVSVVETSDEANTITGIYLYGERDTSTASLITVSSKQYYGWDIWKSESSWFHGRTHIQVNNVSDPTEPTRTKDFSWQGHYVDSRRVDNTLYVVSRFSPYIEGVVLWPETTEIAENNQQLIDNTAISNLLPTLSINNDTPQPLVKSSDCFLTSTLTGDTHGPSLMIITAINLETLAAPTSVCTPAFNAGVYASQSALYLGETYRDFHNQETAIHKFSILDSTIAYKGSGIVKGNLGWGRAGFRMSEHEERLRVISTQYNDNWQPEHSLTILEESDTAASNLDIVSQLPNTTYPSPIGKPNEEIYAVRFFRNKGYVVTFERIDPLYILDLSNALEPRIAGELEVPGFSNYLQILDEDTLLGIGQIDNKSQLSLFDVSDISNPILSDSMVWEGVGTSVTANYDYKALSYLPIPDTQITKIALPVTLRNNWAFVAQGAQLLEIDRANKQITNDGFVTARSTEKGGYSYNKERTIIHGDGIHYIDDALVWSADWNNPDVVSGPVGSTP